MKHNFAIKGTLQLLLNGASTLNQTDEIINMWLELTRSRAYAEGKLVGLRQKKKMGEMELQKLRDMGM